MREIFKDYTTAANDTDVVGKAEAFDKALHRRSKVLDVLFKGPNIPAFEDFAMGVAEKIIGIRRKQAEFQAVLDETGIERLQSESLPDLELASQGILLVRRGVSLMDNSNDHAYRPHDDETNI